MTNVSEKILKALWEEADYIEVNHLKQHFFYETIPSWGACCSEKQKALIRCYYLESYNLLKLTQEFKFKNINTTQVVVKKVLAKICKNNNVSYNLITAKLRQISLAFTIQKLNSDYFAWELALSPKQKLILNLALGLSGEPPLSLTAIAKQLQISRQLVYNYYHKAAAKIKLYHQNSVIYNPSALALVLPIVRGNKSRHKMSLEIGLSPAYYLRLESGSVDKITPRVIKKLINYPPLQEYLTKLTT